MVIVDTSVFVELLRGKSAPVLSTLIASGLVLVSSTVHLELVQGVRRSEHSTLVRFLEVLGEPLSWPQRGTCVAVIKKGRAKGLHVGLPDIMIVSDAIENKAKLLTLDFQLSKLATINGVELISPI